jgi:hypothetical protein
MNSTHPSKHAGHSHHHRDAPCPRHDRAPPTSSLPLWGRSGTTSAKTSARMFDRVCIFQYDVFEFEPPANPSFVPTRPTLRRCPPHPRHAIVTHAGVGIITEWRGAAPTSGLTDAPETCTLPQPGPFFLPCLLVHLHDHHHHHHHRHHHHHHEGNSSARLTRCQTRWCLRCSCGLRCWTPRRC